MRAREGVEGLDRICTTDVRKQKKPKKTPAHLCTDGQADMDGDGATGRHMRPSACCLSVAFLSSPLAVSQIPDDVLTGGLSDWR